jgi:hypothetical protein
VRDAEIGLAACSAIEGSRSFFTPAGREGGGRGDPDAGMGTEAQSDFGLRPRACVRRVLLILWLALSACSERALPLTACTGSQDCGDDLCIYAWVNTSGGVSCWDRRRRCAEPSCGCPFQGVDDGCRIVCGDDADCWPAGTEYSHCCPGLTPQAVRTCERSCLE